MFDDGNDLANALVKARAEGSKRGWLTTLAISLIVTIAVVVTLTVYFFLQLF